MLILDSGSVHNSDAARSFGCSPLSNRDSKHRSNHCAETTALTNKKMFCFHLLCPRCKCIKSSIVHRPPAATPPHLHRPCWSLNPLAMKSYRSNVLQENFFSFLKHQNHHIACCQKSRKIYVLISAARWDLDIENALNKCSSSKHNDIHLERHKNARNNFATATVR